MICKYHWERMEQRVEAARMIDGEPLCDLCIAGAPLAQAKRSLRIDERKFLEEVERHEKSERYARISAAIRKRMADPAVRARISA
ncbi:MAG: hypothetical protein ACRD2O_08980, partial [Terriglobia bacterium]